MLLEFLDRIGCGGILIDAESGAVSLNRAARQILREIGGVGFHPEDAAQARQVLERMLDCEIRRLHEERLFVVRHSDGRWPTVIRALPPAKSDANVITVLLLDLNVPLRLDAPSIQKAFGLTAAEANLAIEIGQGSTLLEISRSQGVSLHTVRGHLTAIFSKTHTRRQAELMALLARFSLVSS
jgi:DNA-binding CsgD family transcriptional regulator